MLESYTQKGGTWQDFVAVFLKDEQFTTHFPDRIIHRKKDFENGQLLDQIELFNTSWSCQNDKKLAAISQIVSEQIVVT